MNLMVSMGVSLVAPSTTRIASLYALSSFSGFVCAAVVGPNPQSMTPSATLVDTVGRGGVVQHPLRPLPSELAGLSGTSVPLVPQRSVRGDPN